MHISLFPGGGQLVTNVYSKAQQNNKHSQGKSNIKRLLECLNHANKSVDVSQACRRSSLPQNGQGCRLHLNT